MKLTTIFSVLMACLLFSSCEIDKYNLDPNRPIEVEPQSILPNVLFQSFKNRYPWQPALATRQITAISDAQDWQTYNFSYGNWDEYNILRDVEKMKESAQKNGSQEAYIGISHILRAHNFFYLTRFYGDIPYSEALKGEDNSVSDRFTPVYDSQKNIIIGILNELEQANQILKNDQLILKGDIIYNGDIKKWRKVANSYKLRILLMLSNKKDDGDLQITQKFAAIMSNPSEFPIFTNRSEELKFNYLDGNETRYPLYEHLDTRNKRYIGKTICDLMKNLQDPRLSYYAMPSNTAKQQGKADSDFSAYQGIDATQKLEDINSNAESGDYSRINQANYTMSLVGKPSLALSYAETMLAIAEAISRGWITGNAETYYNAAVRASMEFYDINDTDLTNYLTTTGRYNAAKALQQIYEQRYILFYHQNDFEPLFHYHRTNYPQITCGMGQVTATVPYKMLYPSTEQTVNKSNWQNALKKQGFASDKIMNKLWIYE